MDGMDGTTVAAKMLLIQVSRSPAEKFSLGLHPGTKPFSSVDLPSLLLWRSLSRLSSPGIEKKALHVSHSSLFGLELLFFMLKTGLAFQ
jgi:hypothetical protein